MKIVKRNGTEVEFDIKKIINAITKANETVEEKDKLSIEEIKNISDCVMVRVSQLPVDTNVEVIQDIVEEELDKHNASYTLKRNYMLYRYQHNELRKSNTIDKTILSLIKCENEDIKQENSNKNPVIISTQRDYMAGEVSKDLMRRYFIDPDLMKAHDEGLIHIHDMDYILQNCHNCDLINLEDMLNNGTVISGTAIDKPHSFSTACNIATQIIAQVASSQYGGQSITLSHLAPFVDVSRKAILKELKEEFPSIDEDKLKEVCHRRLLKEINKGVQIIQYQVVTLMTTNGQAPFITVFMYLNECKDEQTKNDLALIIEEVLKQRIIGVKNEKGVYITPAFPKLIYVLQEDNIEKGSKYYYLTELAAKCTAKRMVPDYISEKIMKEMKEGQVYPSMGAVVPESKVYWKIDGKAYYGPIEKMYHSMIDRYDDLEEDCQFGQEGNPNKDINLKDYNVEIYDNGAGKYVKCLMMNMNLASQFRMYKIRTYNPIDDTDINLVVTHDHPMMKLKSEFDPNLVTIDWNDPKDIDNKCEEIQAEYLKTGDYVFFTKEQRGIRTVEIVDQTIPKPVQILKVPIINNYDFVYDVTTETEHFMVNNLWSHNCRSFLTPWKDENGKYKFYGRFNQGVCTINLIDVACSSGKNIDKFWKIFDERLDMCRRVLMIKHNRLLGTVSDVAPILWQNGALARLNKGEKIDKLLYGGYSTISLGYAGLYECVYYMTGKSHTDPSVKDFALSIMQHMNDMCNKWKKETNIGFSVYGTPLESVTYKFAKCLKKRFGEIPEVTDHNYITNSYHCNVREHINAFDKLTMESEFQRLSPGGAISYVEVPNMQNNIPAVLQLLKHIYNTIMYAEINTKSDYCHECGYTGEIVIEENKDHKLIWKCPNCGNTDQTKMNVARRTCGYIGTNFWNQGRTQEIKDRVLHL